MKQVNMIACVLILFLPILMLSGQTVAPASMITGATATVKNLDVARNTYTLEVVNTATKEITAYEILYTFTYSDGQTTEGEYLADWGPFKTATHQPLQPGDTLLETLYVDPREGVTVATVSVDLVLVTYGDMTAEVGKGGDGIFSGDESFERLRAERAAQAQALQKSADIITDVLNAPDETPAATALRTVTSLRDNPKASHSRELDGVLLDDTIRRLQASPRGTGERDYLRRQLTELQTMATLRQKYAQLRRLP